MIKCTKYVPVNKKSFLGYCDLFMEKWGVHIRGCKVFQKDGKRWVNLPEREYEVDGETKYAPIVKFENWDHQKAFSSQAMKAIEEFAQYE